MNDTNQDRALREYVADILSDGVVDNEEIIHLHEWLTGADDPSETASDLLMLVKEICADKVVHTAERIQLLTALKNIWNQADRKEKGDAFERFVITRFDNTEYRLIEWRSDKKIEGWGWPRSSQWPDLVMEHIQTEKRFAVECKYKGKYLPSTKWAEIYQIDNYQKYEIREEVPVFVAIGVGGCAALPDKLYIAPLNKMTTPKVSLEYLEQYAMRGNVLRLVFEEIPSNHGLESTGAPPAAGTPETHP